MDSTDRFCRRCGARAGEASGFWPFRRPAPSPEQAAGYWRHFFRPFFITALAIWGVFFLAALVMVGIWFFMFRQ